MIITRIVGPIKATEGFAVVVESKNGARRSLIMSAPILSQMTELLTTALYATDAGYGSANARSGFQPSEPIKGTLHVTKVALEPPPPHPTVDEADRHRLHLDDEDGHSLILQIPYEGVVQLRDMLSSYIADFASRRS